MNRLLNRDGIEDAVERPGGHGSVRWAARNVGFVHLHACAVQIADLRGKAFAGNRALGDHQEDGQLQAAVRIILEQTGQKIEDLKAYKNVLKTAKH